MDPKQQLDPKLQEAYNKVMSGSTPPPAAPVVPSAADLQAMTVPPPPAPKVEAPKPQPINPPPPVAAQMPPMHTVSPSVTQTGQNGSASSPQDPVIVNVSTPTPPPPSVAPKPVIEKVHTTQVHGFVAPKKKTAISPVVIGLGIVVFILVYALFWLKFFNIPLPFLPQ